MTKLVKPTFTARIQPYEVDPLNTLKDGRTDAEFLRYLLRTHPAVRNTCQLNGIDPDFIFRDRKNGGRRKGAGNPNWKKD